MISDCPASRREPASESMPGFGAPQRLIIEGAEPHTLHCRVEIGRGTRCAHYPAR